MTHSRHEQDATNTPHSAADARPVRVDGGASNVVIDDNCHVRVDSSWPLCSGPGRNNELHCSNAVHKAGAKYCTSHELQMKKYGRLQPLRTRTSKATCVGPGAAGSLCGRKVFKRDVGKDDGICKSHYDQMKRRGHMSVIAPRFGPIPDTRCSGPGRDGHDRCERVAERVSGLCDAHDRQLKRNSVLKPVRRINTPGGPCVAPGPDGGLCGRPIVNKSNKLCGGHYGQFNRGVDLALLKVTRKRGDVARCLFPKCRYPDAPDGDGLCRHHWRQKRNGKELIPLKGNPNRGKAVLLRDEAGNKLCYSCGVWKPVDEFSKASKSRDGLDHRCKRCHASAQKKARYGMDLDAFEALLASQGGGCGICGVPRRPDEYRLSIDHDHQCCPGSLSCGKCIRGILCPNCNRGLGLFGEDVRVLRQAVAYVLMTDRWAV